MKVQFYTATSLDGFIATESDSLEWLFSLGDVGESSYPEFIADVGAIVMGSKTYEWLLKEVGQNWPYTQPTWVFSSRKLDKIAEAKIEFVQGNILDIFTQIKDAAGEKNIWITGGGDLAGQFYDAGLLNEMIIQIASVTLGKGKQIFPRQIPSDCLSLTSVRQMSKKMVELRYELNHSLSPH